MISMKKIMKRAWELKKEVKNALFSECLKEAWKESKMNTKNKKDECLEVLNKIFNNSFKNDELFKLEIATNDWCKYNKNRTYISIVKKYYGKKMIKFDFGFIDNINNTYVKGNYDLYNCTGVA